MINVFNTMENTAVVNVIITEICDYLSEHTDFELMQDKIINTRARELLYEKYSQTISDIIEQMGEYFQHATQIDKDDRHTYLYDNLCELIHNDGLHIAVCLGWFSFDNVRVQFCGRNHNIDMDVSEFMINTIMEKCVKIYERDDDDE